MVFLKNHTNPTFEGHNQMNMIVFMADCLKKGTLVHDTKLPKYKLDIRSIKSVFKDIKPGAIHSFRDGLVCLREDGGMPNISYMMVVPGVKQSDFFRLQNNFNFSNFSLLSLEEQKFCTKFLHSCEEHCVIAEL